MPGYVRTARALMTVAALSGCDTESPPWAPEGDGIELGGASAAQLGCERYCNDSFSAGCPPAFDTCVESCQTLFLGTCEQKLADYLEAIPFGLSQTCLVGLDEGRRAAMDELAKCQYCGDGWANLVGDRGCESSFVCGLAARCDDDGVCFCAQGDHLVGTCRAIVAGIDACMAGTSCCMVFL